MNGLPSGTSASFSTNPVTPGNSTQLTVSTTGSAATGVYTLQIDGNGDGLQRSTTVELDLGNGTPGAVSLTRPSQGETVATLPNLQWVAAAQASSYRLEIDDDPAFGSPEHRLVTDQTNASPATDLATNTPYYWRVTSINGCSETTGNYQYFVTRDEGALADNCSSPNLAIPDEDPVGVSDSLSPAVSGTITDLDLQLDITHSWIGDLIVELTHVDTGTSAVLIDRPGLPASEFGSDADDITIILDDEADDSAEDSAPYTTNARYQPNNPLSIFDGESIAGTWTLTISDNVDQDTGTLVNWCLQPSVSTSPTSYPLLSINDLSTSEVDASVPLPYTLNTDIDRTTRFDFSTAEDSASAGSDYTALSGSETIPASTSSGNLSLALLSDTVFEEAERFYLILANPQDLIIPDNRVAITLNDRNAAVLSWLSDNGLSLNDLAADGDLDGIDTLLEFGFNLDPTTNQQVTYDPLASVGASGPTGLPRIELSDDGNNAHLRITYPRRKTTTGMQLDYSHWFSNNLSDWLEASDETVESINSDWEQVTVSDSMTLDTAPEDKRFGQVRIDAE